MTRMRSGVGWPSARTTAARIEASSSPASVPSISISSKPERPVSSPPMAMTSPTDFIEVLRSGSEPGYFSKAKRGILVTT